MSTQTTVYFDLVNGPQDGARVIAIANMPDVIYACPKPSSRGAAPWACNKSDHFPVCYVLEKDRYIFCFKWSY